MTPLPLFLLAGALTLPARSQTPGPAIPISVPLDPSTTAPAAEGSATTPAEEVVKLSAKGAFGSTSAEAGDTVDYVLRVEWKETRIPVVVLPPESLETPGFRLAAQSASHRKAAQGDSVANVTEFVYKLLPKAPGNAKVLPLKLRYLTGLSHREEFLYVPGAFLDVAPARIPLHARIWFRILAAFLLLSGLGFGGWRLALAAAEKRRKTREARRRDFAPEWRALKGRWNSADSKIWLEDAEKLCLAWLRHRLEEPAARLETLLERHLAAEKITAAEAEGWAKLRELLHHARYAGGRKEPHELQEAHRILKVCLQIPGENEP